MKITEMKNPITMLCAGAALLTLGACDVKDPIYEPEPPVKVIVAAQELPAQTIKRDFFPTSSPRLLLTGRTDEKFTGVTFAHSYFTLSPSSPSGVKVGAGCVYDSLTFFARFGGTVWGDTTVLQRFGLYRLKELPPQAPVFNITALLHESEPLGSLRVWVKVPSDFLFRLDDALGQELFGMLAAGSSVVKDAAEFREYLKGLVLNPDPYNTCIYALDPSEGGMGITLHWHDGAAARSCSFVTGGAEDASFMNLTNNAAGAPYVVLRQQTDALPFGDVKVGEEYGEGYKVIYRDYPDGQAMVCGISGYMVRMELPGALPGYAEGRTPAKVEIRLHARELQLLDKPDPKDEDQTIKNHWSYPLPAAVRLYETDGGNRVKDAVTDAEGRPVEAVLTDAEAGIYTADITHYCLRPPGGIAAGGGGNIGLPEALLAGVPVDELTASSGLMPMDALPEIRVHWHEPVQE